MDWKLYTEMLQDIFFCQKGKDNGAAEQRKLLIMRGTGARPNQLCAFSCAKYCCDPFSLFR